MPVPAIDMAPGATHAMFVSRLTNVTMMSETAAHSNVRATDNRVAIWYYIELILYDLIFCYAKPQYSLYRICN